MAPKTVILLLALLGAVVCLQGVVVADGNVGGAETVGSLSSTEVTYEASLDEVRTSDGSFPEDVVDEVTSSSVEGDAMEAADEIEGDQVAKDLSLTHQLARILTERSSKRCLSKNHCRKYFLNPGCCKAKCVTLASDNNNCGKCGKCCKQGYCCKSGTCRMPTRNHHSKSTKSHHSKARKPHHNKPHKPTYPQKPSKHDEEKKPHKGGKNPYQPQHGSLGPCGYSKKCSRGFTCCRGKCVNLKSNSGHCGSCDKGCGYWRACAGGQCLDLKHDNRNCGKSGRSCGYGRKCCSGCCKNIFGNDMQNCGACGKKCATKCSYGMCGYGH